MKRTVLSIEDTHGIRRLIRMTLEYGGFEVIEASEASSGMRLALEHRPSLILMETRLPGLDGFQACQALRANIALTDTPVVMLSRAHAASDIEAGLAAGAAKYLTKPFNPVELIAIVNALIEEAEP
jgi:DNA-binding response OmpR family regulator